jgi:DNA-binding GntR family transcriptional regulator
LDGKEHIWNLVRENKSKDGKSPSQKMINPITQGASLSSQAYEHIRAAIIAGEVEPGRLYSVSQFADMLGVSRTPAREALLALVADGLLMVHRNRGYEVAPVTNSLMEEIVEVRRMLEIPAMRRIASMDPRPDDALTTAWTAYKAMTSAADDADLMSFMASDRTFHLALVEATGNSKLTAIVADLRDHMHLPGLRGLAEAGKLHSTVKDHIELLEAIEARDPDVAGRVMERHLNRALAEWVS